MQVDRVASGSVVFEQGERASRAFALGSGSIRISQTGQEGGQAIVRFIAPGEMFGTVPLFTDCAVSPAKAQNSPRYFGSSSHSAEAAGGKLHR
ncbi:cyclic nucleotide-binding domain-containing protein [Sphingomonas histidinilytica]|uniref:cyclic nucleotide-binding domain-containing protein n=1 Tax=Rhizorhabdus histidinilytica TaxID=439228 RepID=UPI001ADB4C4D|nr:cyclic nucleotide-binding domain-containing protein [Rhizorhabdus histidinilytica]MBO9380878.1 cyclic nucleotide-binding domain-containing protein [Rhizorhabdus histidinilytica]